VCSRVKLDHLPVKGAYVVSTLGYGNSHSQAAITTTVRMYVAIRLRRA
jgi:hypothetical protein